MTDIGDKAKIRALGQLVHLMFMRLVNTGVIEQGEAKRTIDSMIDGKFEGNEEYIEAQYLERIRNGLSTTGRPKPEKEVASKRSKGGKSKN
jgi:hypothetical protein